MKTFAMLAVLLGLAGCAGGARYITGTKVVDTDENREILRTVERYRLAMEQKDTAALLAMASKQYWEDGGTTGGADDYGYEGLRNVIANRFQRADAIRYSVRYLGVTRKGRTAEVVVLVDASYTLAGPQGEERRDMRDQNKLVLELEDVKAQAQGASEPHRQWFFLSGM